MTPLQGLHREGLHEAVADSVLEGMTASVGDAKGLPNAAFTDPAFLELERKHLFARSWVFAGPRSAVGQPGAVKCLEVAGRQLFMTTDRKGDTRVFFNVCPHRGARLVIEDQDKAASLTCPYHGWAFGLDGSLRGRPHFHGPREHDREGSRAERDCLFEVRSAVWHDWVFVNIDGQAEPFEDYMATAYKEYGDWDFGKTALAHYQPFRFQANWKLVVENFCDNYHVFMVHPALHDAQDVYRRTGMRPGGAHMFNEFVIGAEGLGLTVDPEAPVLPEFPNLSPENRNVSPFCNIFPNVTLAIFPTYVNLFCYEPVSVDETIMHVWFYFMDEAATGEGDRAGREAVIADWANLNAEDSGICRRLQEGRTCDAYEGGRFSPYWDAGTLHFHKQIANGVRGEGVFAR